MLTRKVHYVHTGCLLSDDGQRDTQEGGEVTKGSNVNGRIITDMLQVPEQRKHTSHRGMA